MMPNFLIIGAQKSASTFIHECVREHPEVFIHRDEIHFFADPDYLQSDISQLEALFCSVKSEKAIGIKRPDYLARAEVPSRIYKHIPNARLIVILRNPIERAISAYYWYMKLGFIPIRPVEAGLTDILHGLYKDQYPKAQEIVDYGFYYQHLRRYLKHFDRRQLLTVLYRDLRANPLQCVKQIYKFLQVDDDYVPKSLVRKPKQTIYSLTRLRLITKRNPFIYTYNHNRTRVMPKKSLSAMLINGVIVLSDRVLLAPFCDNTKPKPSDILRNNLLSIYEEDICNLEKLLNLDLVTWKT